MGQLSARLRSVEGDGLIYWCQGCKATHMIRHGAGVGPRWKWNGDVEAPTFEPSVLSTSGHYMHGHKPEDQCWCDYNKAHPEEADDGFSCARCHTFIRDGMVQFLDDCTHEFAGQTVPMPDLPEYMQDKEQS